MSWLVEFVKAKEGFRSSPYLDAVGVPTIGYGTTYYPDKTPVTMTDVSISKEEAEILLRHSLNYFLDYVVNYGPLKGYNWNNNQIGALSSFCYNLGRSRLSNSQLMVQEVMKRLLRRCCFTKRQAVKS